MSELKFTKGEWNIRRDQDTYEVYVKTYSNGMSFLDYVADVYEKEDANLIAAAPAMYKALEIILENQALGSPLALSINNLLAKARGE